jgi:plasmid stabilization system protein ParE
LVVTRRVWVTRRALRDLAAIETYSEKRFGPDTAARYLTDLEQALRALAEPGPFEDMRLNPAELGHSRLGLARVREHVLVHDQFGSDVVVLAVWHRAMDLQGRLLELEPTLLLEAELLHRRIERERRGQAPRDPKG